MLFYCLQTQRLFLLVTTVPLLKEVGAGVTTDSSWIYPSSQDHCPPNGIAMKERNSPIPSTGKNPNKDLEPGHTALLPHPPFHGVPMWKISQEMKLYRSTGGGTKQCWNNAGHAVSFFKVEYTSYCYLFWELGRIHPPWNSFHQAQIPTASQKHAPCFAWL